MRISQGRKKTGRKSQGANKPGAKQQRGEKAVIPVHALMSLGHSFLTELKVDQPAVTVGSWSRITVAVTVDLSSFLSESSTVGIV